MKIKDIVWKENDEHGIVGHISGICFFIIEENDTNFRKNPEFNYRLRVFNLPGLEKYHFASPEECKTKAAILINDLVVLFTEE